MDPKSDLKNNNNHGAVWVGYITMNPDKTASTDTPLGLYDKPLHKVSN